MRDLIVLALTIVVGIGPVAAAPSPCPRPEAIADGVLVFYGSGGKANAENQGRIGNTTVLMGPSGMIVIDPGPGRRQGQAIACGLRRLGRQPIVALINTHPHPENVLANAAFPGVPLYATAEATAAMRDRCAGCLKRLTEAVGAGVMEGTRARLPDRPIRDETRIRPGGRSLVLIPLGNAHSPGDLAVFDEASATLVGGDVATVAETPDLRDGTTQGWIAALDRLRALAAARIVPGRGATYAPAGLERIRDYLQRLAAAAETAAETGEWPPRFVGEEEFAPQLARFAELHPLNLQHALREAEAEWWRAPPGAARAGRREATP